MSNSSNPMELLQLGQASARVGRQEEARQYLRRAVELNPKNVDAWLALAGVEQDPLQKMVCFDTVLELDAGNVEARLGIELLQNLDSVNDTNQVLESELDTVLAEASRRLDAAVGPPAPDEIPPDDTTLHCANHPNVETMLRCNRCSKPICTKCAVQTPVGYRCRECVGAQQAVFFSGGPLDYVIAGIIAVILGGIAGYLMTLLGAWFFALILGPAIGIGIAETVRLAVRRRRSRYLWMTVGIGIVVGSLPALLLSLGSLWGMLSLGLFLVLAVGAATARLR